MLIHSIKAQMNIMFRRKLIWVTFYFILICVVMNYLSNVIQYAGYDVLHLPHPAKTLLISAVNVKNTTISAMLNMRPIFQQLYPLIVVLPAGFSLAQDYESRETVFIYSRVGGKNYYVGKLIACFLTTAFIVMVPLMLELVMNFVSYPIGSIGDPMNIEEYSEMALARYDEYLYGGLEVGYPYLAAIFGISMIGIFSGVLGIFTVAISTFRIKFKILLFLPVYVLLFGLMQLENTIPYCVNYSYYMNIFCPHPNKSLVGFVGIIVILAIFSIIVMIMKGRKELL